jgi:D-alanine transaminase
LRCDIKSIALLGNVLLRQQAREAGADECLLVRDGVVTEGAASNVFVVAGRRVLTPSKSHLLLSGVTREFVIELLRSAGYGDVEAPVSMDLLRGADEIWITSSSMEVRPIVTLDDRPIGTGAPGPVYDRIRSLFLTHEEVRGVAVSPIRR